jgi:Fur family iron response transcriptional regulator
MNAHCLSLHEIEARLRAAGIQPTAQRLAICQYVLCQADHPTAEQVKQWVDGHFPKISLATVYNTLNTLAQAGLLRELRLSDRDSAVYDANVSEHFHFVDESTGKIWDLTPDAIDVRPQLGEGFQVRHVDVVLRGSVTSPAG